MERGERKVAIAQDSVNRQLEWERRVLIRSADVRLPVLERIQLKLLVADKSTDPFIDS